MDRPIWSSFRNSLPGYVWIGTSSGLKMCELVMFASDNIINPKEFYLRQKRANGTSSFRARSGRAVNQFTPFGRGVKVRLLKVQSKSVQNGSEIVWPGCGFTVYLMSRSGYVS